MSHVGDTRKASAAIGTAILLASGLLAMLTRPLHAAPQPTLTPAPGATRTPAPSPTRATATVTPSATLTPTWTATLGAVGPQYLEGHNPLTGLPVIDPNTLYQVPLLVSITEFPPSSRPQSGLSAAAQIWETSIGEGMSRFLAVYYGDYLETLSQLMQARSGADAQTAAQAVALGPIRSGRIGYEEIRSFYPRAMLIIRYASPEVAEQLSNLVTIYADDVNDVNSATLTLDELRALEVGPAHPADYASLTFDPRPPAGGQPGSTLDVIYNLYDQIRWVYNPHAGAYLRWQDRADGTGTLYPLVDRLTGRQLQAENVLLMFARHKFENIQGTILDIELAFLPKRNGVLFRDGQMYEVHWSSRQLKLRLEDDQGRPVPLKPGLTFFQLVSFQSTWDEEARTARFHNPPLPTPTRTPTPTKLPFPDQTETAAAGASLDPTETPAPTSTPGP